MTPGAGEFRTAGREVLPVRPLDLSGRERQLRGAMLAMDRIGTGFARYARRSMPFLARNRARLTPGTVQIASIAGDPGDPAEGPTFSVAIGTEDSMVWASVMLNMHAVTVTLEGALGGNSSLAPTPLAGPDLTPAQRALLTRVGRSLALDLATAIREEVGLTMVVLPPDASPPSVQRSDALQLACEIEGLQVPASIIISASAEALEVAAREHGSGGDLAQGDPRLAEAMREVPIEVIAELGRISVGLRRILSWRVGDVLRLTTATDDSVSVRLAGVEKFVGSPILSRGQLAIEIKSRHER
jgi:flagellar motor switch protein FliM